MDHHNVINTLDYGERVTSTYAEVYFEDNYSQSNKTEEEKKEVLKTKTSIQHIDQDKWVSPSDQLIGIIKLKPPFTTKITRGKAHEGVLAIGNSVLENKRSVLYRKLKSLLHYNDASWEYIMSNEKNAVIQKVTKIFENIYKQKKDIMAKEISLFYENLLHDLEEKIKSEVETVLLSTHANVISNLNNEIEIKLKNEKNTLENNLCNKYFTEVRKIKEYYKLLLNNELMRHKKIINHVLQDRNDALKAYYKLIEAEKITSAMYILSLERKKCIIKKMFLEKYQCSEISQKLQKLKEKQGLLDVYQDNKVHFSLINKHWKTKIKNILQLFLKFISFSLKLLPEQTTFLLDFEKMVILQLNEIQKNPDVVSSILVDENENANIFKFQESEIMQRICEKEPFTLIGDLSVNEPTKYGSRETLTSDVDLPYFRVQREFVYAKCHGFEDIKKVLEAQVCKCCEPLPETPKHISVCPSDDLIQPQSSLHESKSSSNEELDIEDIQRFQECPVRKCGYWTRGSSFPHIASYLDFNEKNFERVKTILTEIPSNQADPILINPKDIAYRELPFSVTKELHKSIETQYSSQEDLTKICCSCIDGMLPFKSKHSQQTTEINCDYTINDILTKRKISLNRLLQEHPKLLELLSDETFDYKL